MEVLFNACIRSKLILFIKYIANTTNHQYCESEHISSTFSYIIIKNDFYDIICVKNVC